MSDEFKLKLNLSLEEVCWKCHGSGELYRRDGESIQPVQCDMCDGVGTNLTEFGELVWNMVVKRLTFQLDSRYLVRKNVEE